MEKKFIPVILGTNRKGRQSKKVADFVLTQLDKLNNVETKLIDVADAKPKEGDYGLEYEGYNKIIERADALVVVSPEYNHSFPGCLKSLMDMAYEEYRGKSVGLVGVSVGTFGGARVIESLLPVMKAYGLCTIQKDLNISDVNNFSENDEKLIERTQAFLGELT